VSAGDNKYKDK